MPEPLKLMYSAHFFERLCPVLKDAVPDFEERRFLHFVFDRIWPDLELKQRTMQITRALQSCLDTEYPKAVHQLIAITRRLRETEKAQQYPYVFIPEYVASYGLDHFALSMAAIEETTKLVSAEFAIRPFIARYPNETMQYMLRWSQHPDAFVRRLASEGCRPRLPWGTGLSEFKKDPSPILPILENLKSDTSEYVRRSVANNLNDIAKDHPEIALRLAKKWCGVNPATDWIVKHGCRTLLKRGDKAALHLHGLRPSANAYVERFEVTRKVAIGEQLHFSFNFFHQEKNRRRFRLDYAIDYLTRSGRISRKIFKITENNFEPGLIVNVQRKQSFKNLTTRKHFKGKHLIRILANSKEVAKSEFFVC